MNWSKLALFSSGFFFGGAVDHVILAFLRRTETPYGINLGTAGNWWLALLDLSIAALLYVAHRLIDSRRARTQ